MSTNFQDAFLGALVADAVAMPVHWYYDRAALDRDYGAITDYLAPKNPHADSILWRSQFTPPNAKAEILHDQARYWGQRSVHYHQFLDAGENTINYRLSVELYRKIIIDGAYVPENWLERYIELMLDPGFHNDTYLEEYHRGFFMNYAAGRKPAQCGIDDIHIGGLSQIPALLAGLDALGEMEEADALQTVRIHVSLTHKNRNVIEAAEVLTRLIFQISNGGSLHDAICKVAGGLIGGKRLDAWSRREDRDVVGNEVSPACYLPGSFVAALFLAWKYAKDFTGGVCANAMVGGDSCHRGAVTGALLGAVNGIPGRWLRGLKAMENLRCDEPAIDSGAQ
jgi:ADP-ribosyl-[dinitrogen reductase] hydrolase